MCKISIIVVCLNPGSKLIETMESIRMQSFQDYEVVVKDGFSKDGSIAMLKEWLTGTGAEITKKVHVYQRQDKSIYDAMNQAIYLAGGEYLYFLNCGDRFYKDTALKDMITAMQGHPEGRLFYGNVYDAIRDSVVQSNPHTDAFACYRNVPCHQACIYHRSLFTERGYEPKYRVRADYEHFLWCFFAQKIEPVYLPVTLALYEGGGFSETKANRVRSRKEHSEIISMYMTRGQILKYRLIMLLSLQPLRTAMAESKLLGGLYQKVKRLLYKK